MLIGDVQVWSGSKMIKGLSGDTNMPESYAQSLSSDRRGLEVHWICTNGPRKVSVFVDGSKVR